MVPRITIVLWHNPLDFQYPSSCWSNTRKLWDWYLHSSYWWHYSQSQYQWIWILWCWVVRYQPIPIQSNCWFHCKIHHQSVRLVSRDAYCNRGLCSWTSNQICVYLDTNTHSMILVCCSMLHWVQSKCYCQYLGPLRQRMYQSDPQQECWFIQCKPMSHNHQTTQFFHNLDLVVYRVMHQIHNQCRVNQLNSGDQCFRWQLHVVWIQHYCHIVHDLRMWVCSCWIRSCWCRLSNRLFMLCTSNLNLMMPHLLWVGMQMYQ